MTHPDHDALLKGTEIYDTDIPRVDAVHGPATGIPFLIMKSADLPSAQPLRKADAMADEIVDTDIDTPIVQGEEVDPAKAGDADMPGSPTWEAVDAAKARTVVSQLTSIRALIGELAGREMTEADSDADGDSYTAWNLQDAQDAIDCALGTFAKYAVDEQNESDTAAQEAEDSARAMGLIKALDLAPVVKAGRVLSGPNEASIRQALELLTNVLAAVDTAPIAAEGGETVTVAKAFGDAPIPAGVQDLLEQLIAAYNEAQSNATDGTSPAVTPNPADPTAPVDPAAPAPGDAPVVADPAVPAADPNVPATPDPTVPAAPAPPAPAPAAPAPAPAAPAPDPNAPVDPNAIDPDDTVAKSTNIETLIAEAVAKALAPVQQRLAQVEATPVNDGPMLHGATGQGAPVLRGHAGTPQEELLKQLDTVTDPKQRHELQLAAALKLAAHPPRANR